jgi:hypothetical protein
MEQNDVTDVDQQGRPEPPLDADEAGTLGFLDFLRGTIAWKCAGLDADGLRATVGPSTMTLGGVLKHLAYVEDDWSGRWVWGEARDAPWGAVDWQADPDWDWHSAADDAPEELRALWEAAEPALGGGPPDRGVRPPLRARRSAA